MIGVQAGDYPAPRGPHDEHFFLFAAASVSIPFFYFALFNGISKEGFPCSLMGLTISGIQATFVEMCLLQECPSIGVCPSAQVRDNSSSSE